jgi:integrase
MLRRFLAFLHSRGVTPTDLSAVVLSVRCYQHEQCPRFLTRTQIEALLAAIDRDTLLGKRDYAMVLLLAIYGLRGLEVVHLRLDDIDWRRQQLHINRRKAGNDTTYPLATSVGEALLVYLRQVRPPSSYREIFLTMEAPVTPFCGTATLRKRIQKYASLAGVEAPRLGAHVFRYSCAQRLFEQGTPFKTIADYLGHGALGSTRRYVKIALEQLREVALGEEEDLL